MSRTRSKGKHLKLHAPPYQHLVKRAAPQAVSQARMEREESGRLKVFGVLNFDTVPALWKQARSLFNKNESPNLCIDLGGVTRCDSAGLALLIEWTRSARRARKAIVFMNVPEQMLSLARVSSLEGILPLARQ